MNSIFHRISVRKYEDRPVEKEKIMEILRAGMQAPSACNQQPWEFYPMRRKTPCFSYGDIRRVHRIYASN